MILTSKQSFVVFTNMFLFLYNQIRRCQVVLITEEPCILISVFNNAHQIALRVYTANMAALYRPSCCF